MLNFHQLDAEYKSALTALKHRLANLHDPNEITICAKWIHRFNGAQPEERYERNRLVKLLIDQLAEDNLNYPFIFLNNLEKPLHFPDVHFVMKAGTPNPSPPSTPSELDDILNNLNQLLSDAETLNLKTEEDLESIKSELHVGDSIMVSASKDLDYFRLLVEETKNILTNQIPKIIELPETPIRLSKNLKPADSDWISSALRKIKEEVTDQQKSRSDSISSASQTDQSGHELDQTYYERKFARLYADSMLKDQARQIHLKSAEGLMELNLSQKLREHFLQKLGQKPKADF